MKIEIQQTTKPLHQSHQGQKIMMQEQESMSTQEGTGVSLANGGQNTYNINNEIMKDREKLIKYNRAFIKKNKKVPTTTLDFYKFVKVSYLLHLRF